MRNKNTIFMFMAQDTTNTYQQAKTIFNSLGLKEDTFLDIDEINVKLFRKHLSEMIKRQGSSNRYATRYVGEKVKVVRIQ